jgi:hypothetical protein
MPSTSLHLKCVDRRGIAELTFPTAKKLKLLLPDESDSAELVSNLTLMWFETPLRNVLWMA